MESFYKDLKRIYTLKSYIPLLVSVGLICLFLTVLFLFITGIIGVFLFLTNGMTMDIFHRMCYVVGVPFSLMTFFILMEIFLSNYIKKLERRIITGKYRRF